MTPRAATAAISICILLLAPGAAPANDADTRRDATDTTTAPQPQPSEADTSHATTTPRMTVAPGEQQLIRVATPGEIRIYPVF